MRREPPLPRQELIRQILTPDSSATRFCMHLCFVFHTSARCSEGAMYYESSNARRDRSLRMLMIARAFHPSDVKIRPSQTWLGLYQNFSSRRCNLGGVYQLPKRKHERILTTKSMRSRHPPPNKPRLSYGQGTCVDLLRSRAH